MSFSEKISKSSISQPTQEEFLLAAGKGDVDVIRNGLKTINPTTHLQAKEVFKTLFEEDKDKATNFDYNSIEVACLKNQAGVIDVLLQDERVKNVLNEKDVRGQTVLHLIASKTGTKNIAQKLLDAGVKIDAVDSRGQTAFGRAVQYDNRELVELYLAHDEAHPKDEKAELDKYIFSVLSNIVEEYAHGHLVNFSADADGITPLYFAINNANNPDNLENGKIMVSLLLKHGANPLQIIDKEQTLIQMAQKRKVPKDIIIMLQDKAKEIEARAKRLQESPEASEELGET